MLAVRMQPVDKFMLAVGLLWCLFMLYGIILLLPSAGRRLWEWDARRRRNYGAINVPTYPQRVVFLLLASLMATVAFAAAFHCNLVDLTGFSSGTAVVLMTLLPMLYFTLGWLNKTRKNRRGPDATRG